jgi:hypothetical protein
MERIVEKLRKIKELSERGFGGEAQAAKLALEKLLSKHNLTMDNLLDEELKLRCFARRSKNDYAILCMCYLKVVGAQRSRTFYKRKGKGEAYKIYVMLTEIEFAEIYQLYDFHRANFGAEFQRMSLEFQRAYQHKHNLYAADSESDCKLSLEEIARILEYSNGMSDNKFVKRIEK